LKEYRYFTYARINGKKQKDAFGDPVDHWLAFNPKKRELTLHLILGKRVTVVTSRFVDAISAGVGHRPLLGVYAPDGKMHQTIADDQWRLACAGIKNFATPVTTFVRRFDPSA